MDCPYCGKSLPADAVYCLACGRRQPQPAAPAAAPAPAHVGKICPYCQTPLKPQDRVIVCPQCGMPHHQDCWQDNGGCTTYGCATTGAREALPVSPEPAADDHLDLTDILLPEPGRSANSPKPSAPLFVITLIILMAMLLLFVVFESIRSAQRRLFPAIRHEVIVGGNGLRPDGWWDEGPSPLRRFTRCAKKSTIGDRLLV